MHALATSLHSRGSYLSNPIVLIRRKYPPAEIIRITVRRRWLILVPLAAGLAMAPTIARAVPERYRSETLIRLAPQRVPDGDVKSKIAQTVSDRLPSITDQILSRSRLAKIIADLNLYSDERTRELMENVVQRVRSDITIRLDTSNPDSFRVSFISDNPETARRVTERLASLYIEQNLPDVNSHADSLNQPLETRLQDAKQRLIEHQQQLDEYLQRFAGQVPSQLQQNLRAIQDAQMQLLSINDAMNRAREQRSSIERQVVADAHAASTSPTQSVGLANATEAARPLTTRQQLGIARARLRLSMLRFPPGHPEVLSLQRNVADLQTRLEQEARIASAVSEVERTSALTEVEQEKRLNDLLGKVEEIDRQLSANSAEVARLKRAIASYQAQLNLIPARESELLELTRDYSTLQAAYTGLLTQREDSQVAANQERPQMGEQFEVLAPASLPERPYNEGRRLATISAGAVGGLVFGLFMIGFLEARDTTFKREEDVLRVLTCPVLALIPVMPSQRERQTQRRRAWAVDFAGIALLVGSVAVLALWRTW